MTDALFSPRVWGTLLFVGVITTLQLGSCPLFARTTPPAYAIASAHPLATEAGMRILAEGGNAFDAAVAVTAALAVVEPYSSGLGGGGFWLLHRASDGLEIMLDGRERAPLAADRRMYLDVHGELIPGRSVDGALAAAIPGTVAAIVHLAQRYGRLPLATDLNAAIHLAELGFVIDEVYRSRAEFRLKVLQDSPGAAVFLQDGQVPELGYRLRQKALAKTLRLIANDGAEGFYAGEVAEKLVAGVREAGGIWTLEDLQRYRVKQRQPVTGRYRNLRFTSASPPSAGGVGLVEMLNILSGYSLDSLNKLTRTHLLVEAMRRAYRDRAQYLGDPDSVAMPLAQLASPVYAAGLRIGIRPDRATPSAELSPITVDPAQGQHTTHFSILDAAGNRVAATLSINYPFGSGFVPAETGVLLNDEMDDFATKPASPNVYGLVGADANAIEGGKRMLSSMTPTFLDDGHRLAILGTPGGSRIITMVLLATLEFARGGNAQAMVNLPRLHHQYLPDVIQFEPEALDNALEAKLNSLGHATQRLSHPYGNMQAIVWDRQTHHVEGASDPRGIGRARVQPVNVGTGRSNKSRADAASAR